VEFLQLKDEVILLYQADIPRSSGRPGRATQSVIMKAIRVLWTRSDSTIGFNDKTFIDGFDTPHTPQLHVIERWHLIEGGETRSTFASRIRAPSRHPGPPPRARLVSAESFARAFLTLLHCGVYQCSPR
jgi:hypothetical protein